MKYPRLKEWLTKFGASLSERKMHFLNGVFNHIYVGHWMRQRGYGIPFRRPNRESVYQTLSKNIVEPVTYLEFGVFDGTSMRRWSKLLQNPETTFSGFDSFEGLPEKWRMAADKETFNLKGNIPQFDDKRVKLFQGWFTDTLPDYLKNFQPKGTLVLHLDADLYISTIFVLNQLRPFLQPGTILLFDEFFDHDHELRALEEFLNQTQITLECLGASRALTQVAFKIISVPKITK
jgi:hypothetical protein